MRDPRLEALSRELRWVVTLANLPSLVGSLHRQLAVIGDAPWQDPTPSLASALTTVGWTLVRNTDCVRASRWPLLAPEPSYPGSVVLQPSSAPVPSGTVWTDGSVSTVGGAAAALQPATDAHFSCRVDEPSSSTQCEVVALSLVAHFSSPPRLVLTDSLVALQLIKTWGTRSVRAILSCPERLEIRCFMHHWQSASSAPTLAKVKAHDLAAIQAGDLRACGNDKADALARAAVGDVSAPLFCPDARFADAVRVRASNGDWVADVPSALASYWWSAARGAVSARRTWFNHIYPPGLAIDWPTSVHLFRPPHVVNGAFVHVVGPPVSKWVARARAGALAIRGRLAKTGLSSSPQCPCCPCPLEDDAHAVAACPATGAQDCAALASRLWLQVARRRGVLVSSLPDAWVEAHVLLLAVAVLPMSLRGFLSGTSLDSVVTAFLQDFHVALAERLAEVLRRREELIAMTSSRLVTSAASTATSSSTSSSVASQRQLSVAELRAAERTSSSSCSSGVAPPPQVGSKALAAQKRIAAQTLHLWIKQHRFLRAVPIEQGETSVALLLLWEADHGRPYPSQAVELVGRLTTFSKRLDEAVAADEELRAWLVRKQMHVTLTPGLTPSLYFRWAVAINPAVGEPFLSSWKAHLTSLVVQQHAISAAAMGSGSPRRKRLKREVQHRQGVKRPRASSSTELPPDNSTQARVARLLAARAAGAGDAVTSSTTTTASTTSSSSGLPPPSASHGCGRASLGPPT